MSPLVFLHGWGQSRQAWFQQHDAFPQADFIQLAGHGGRADADNMVLDVLQQLPEQGVTLVGWSLGGMLAMRLARQYPERINRLILFNTTPSFCQRSGWAHGCDDALLQQFKQGIARAEAKTMSRFFALMFHGTDISKQDYQYIARHAVDKRHPPTPQALKQGLEILAQWDLREELAGITQPTLVIHGEKDAVIPVQAGQYLAQHIPHAAWHACPDAGHAPFLTHPQACHDILESWCPTH